MHCNAVWYHAAKQIAQYCQLLTVTQETEAAFGTEIPRTPSSIASHKAMQSAESVGVCFSSLYLLCSTRTSWNTCPFKRGQMAITAKYSQETNISHLN